MDATVRVTGTLSLSERNCAAEVCLRGVQSPKYEKKGQAEERRE